MSLRTRQFERILLIKPSALGDVIHTLPILVKLRARYPAAQIDWLIAPENADLVRCHPGLSNVVLFRRREYARFGRSWSASAELARLLYGIWRTHYDLVIDLHGLARSALLTLATACKTRIGFENTREGAWLAYSHRIPVPSMEVHAVDRYLRLGDLLGFDDQPPDFHIFTHADAAARADALLARQQVAGKSLALVVPGTVWETKHWPTGNFAAVARHLRDSGHAVVVAGSGRDKDRCRTVVQSCPGACDLSGQTTLAELVELIRRATICVTNDSGSMHLAAALGKPVASVFGPTNPVRTGPYRHLESVLRADLPCSPCYLRKLQDCAHEHKCMTQVTPALVIERVEQLLRAA